MSAIATEVKSSSMSACWNVSSLLWAACLRGGVFSSHTHPKTLLHSTHSNFACCDHPNSLAHASIIRSSNNTNSCSGT